MFSWRIYVAGNYKTYLSLHILCLTFCPILTKFGFSLITFPIPNFTETDQWEQHS